MEPVRGIFQEYSRDIAGQYGNQTGQKFTFITNPKKKWKNPKKGHRQKSWNDNVNLKFECKKYSAQVSKRFSEPTYFDQKWDSSSLLIRGRVLSDYSRIKNQEYVIYLHRKELLKILLFITTLIFLWIKSLWTLI